MKYKISYYLQHINTKKKTIITETGSLVMTTEETKRKKIRKLFNQYIHENFKIKKLSITKIEKIEENKSDK